MDELFEAVLEQARKDEVYARQHKKVDESVHEFIDGKQFVEWLDRVGLDMDKADEYRRGFWHSVEKAMKKPKKGGKHAD